MFTPKCGKPQGTIWNKWSIFKGNTGGESEDEAWIKKVKGSSFYASQKSESDRLFICVSDMPFLGYFLQSRELWILWHWF